MPGMTPAWADSRRQMRQSPNLRNTARGRPHEWQRLYFWVLYFGVRDAFTRRLVLATLLLSAAAPAAVLALLAPPAGGALLGGVALGPEREPQVAQEGPALLVGARRGGDGHVEPARLVDPVVVDLREDRLLAQTQIVVAAAVEAVRVDAAEVADPRERDRREPVEELPHAVAAQGHLAADRHALAQLELGDRLARPRDVGALPGDHRQLVHGVVEGLVVGLGLAHAHRQGDLLQARVLHRRAVAELLLQLRSDVLLVDRAAAGGRGRGVRCRGLRDLGRLVGHYSSTSPERTATRTRSTSLTWILTRVGRSSLESISATFDRW